MGFSGCHLTDLLKGCCSYQVYLTDRLPSNLDNFFICNLGDMRSVLGLIKKTRPDQIYHLAGSFSNDYDIDYEANVLGLKNILDSLLALELRTRVLVVGSSAEYGIVDPGNNPVCEDHPLAPVSVYGLTKLYQTCLMLYYCSVHKMDIVMARTFNLFGRGMSKHLFVGRVYDQIRKYMRGEISKVSVGNLLSKRDYIDVFDAIKSYELIMNHGSTSEIYNVGSGRSIMIKDLLQKIFDEFELSMDILEVKVEPNPKKFDISDIYADISKLNALKRKLK
jgi:GDP-4-dehydro-6-deoxy-D-mannose reductase